MSVSGIYKITNKINKKCYYGSAVDFNTRWSLHRSELKNNIHGNKHLQAAYNKYGEVAFIYSILMACPEKELLIYEQHWLNAFWDGGKTCYNICKIAGSQLGCKRSDEIKAKMRASKLKEHKEKISISVSATMTPEHRKRLSAAKLGKKASEEAKANMSKSKLGNTNCLGYRHSEEAKSNMSAAQKNMPEATKIKRSEKMSRAGLGRPSKRKGRTFPKIKKEGTNG